MSYGSERWALEGHENTMGDSRNYNIKVDVCSHKKGQDTK